MWLSSVHSTSSIFADDTSGDLKLNICQLFMFSISNGNMMVMACMDRYAIVWHSNEDKQWFYNTKGQIHIAYMWPVILH